jgi:predicted Fe-Mo cluster-binding NifX family protein
LTKRIVIPVENQAGLEAKVAQHFGRAPYYAVVELDESGQIAKIETQANTGEHMGGTGHPHENLLALKPDVIIAYGMGPGGLLSFKSSGATVLKATGNTVKEAIESLKEGKLIELAGGCEHAHEHH